MDRQESLKLTDREITAAFAAGDDASQYPPVLTVEDAAKLLRVPVNTIRDWRSRGLLAGCCRRIGRRLLFWRDRLIKHLFNGDM